LSPLDTSSLAALHATPRADKNMRKEVGSVGHFARPEPALIGY
jgi:hypothetical protein